MNTHAHTKTFKIKNRHTSSKRDSLWHDRDLLQLLAQPPSDQYSRQVGRDLDACTDFTNRRRALDDGNAMPGMCECMRGGESPEAAAYDEDVERERCFAAVVEFE